MWYYDVRDGDAVKIATVLDGAGDVACVWCRYSCLLKLGNDQTHAENAENMKIVYLSRAASPSIPLLNA